MAAKGQDVDRILKEIPDLCRGPGGAVAVVQNGTLSAQHIWGYADLEDRIPMKRETLMPICSISKQMVCLALVSLVKDPTPKMLSKGVDPWDQFSAELKTILPQLNGHQDGELKVSHLYNMQSGIRDYWCMTTAWGARPEGVFSLAEDAPRTLQRTSGFHFPPGSESSYSNVNFHILGVLIERVSGRSLGQILTDRVFIPAGMSTAALSPNTASLPLPIAGYEGDENHGFIKALNRIEWGGDAGIVASLEDMVAYEQYLEASWNDTNSLYRIISQPQTFNDGTPAPYGFGLKRVEMEGITLLGHGGALRGFRLSRLHIPSQRTSVVIMLNHEADPSAPTEHILKKLFGLPDPEPFSGTAAEDWTGEYLDPDTKLCVNVAKGENKNELLVKFASSADKLILKDADRAESRNTIATIEHGVVKLHLKSQNHTVQLTRLTSQTADKDISSLQSQDYVGDYYCSAADTIFRCTGEGKMMYGSFDGFLGKGPVNLMRHISDDIWVVGNPRGMDAAPPGDWTVIFHRNQEGKVQGATIGCFLARKLEFVRRVRGNVSMANLQL